MVSEISEFTELSAYEHGRKVWLKLQ